MVAQIPRMESLLFKFVHLFRTVKEWLHEFQEWNHCLTLKDFLICAPVTKSYRLVALTTHPIVLTLQFDLVLTVDLILSSLFNFDILLFIFSSSSILISRFPVTLHSSLTAPTFSM